MLKLYLHNGRMIWLDDKYTRYIQELQKMKPSEQIEKITGIKLLTYQKLWIDWFPANPSFFSTPKRMECTYLGVLEEMIRILYKNGDEMRVRDILTEKPINCIMVRCNSPVPDEEDTLFGYCQWDGKELVSLNGDSYYLDEKSASIHLILELMV